LPDLSIVRHLVDAFSQTTRSCVVGNGTPLSG
jgi:hypothetical protein